MRTSRERRDHDDPADACKRTSECRNPEYTVMTDILVEKGICNRHSGKECSWRYFKAPCERHGSGDPAGIGGL